MAGSPGRRRGGRSGPPLARRVRADQPERLERLDGLDAVAPAGRPRRTERPGRGVLGREEQPGECRSQRELEDVVLVAHQSAATPRLARRRGRSSCARASSARRPSRRAPPPPLEGGSWFRGRPPAERSVLRTIGTPGRRSSASGGSAPDPSRPCRANCRCRQTPSSNRSSAEHAQPAASLGRPGDRAHALPEPARRRLGRHRRAALDPHPSDRPPLEILPVDQAQAPQHVQRGVAAHRVVAVCRRRASSPRYACSVSRSTAGRHDSSRAKRSRHWSALPEESSPSDSNASTASGPSRRVPGPGPPVFYRHPRVAPELDPQHVLDPLPPCVGAGHATEPSARWLSSPAMATLRRVRPRDGGVLSDLRLRALAGDPLAFGSTLEREAPWDDEWDDWARRHADGGDEATFIAIADDGSPAGLAGGFRNAAVPASLRAVRDVDLTRAPPAGPRHAADRGHRRLGARARRA